MNKDNKYMNNFTNTVDSIESLRKSGDNVSHKKLKLDERQIKVCILKR